MSGPAPGPVTWLTEAETDQLNECERGHFVNEHSSDGCLATSEDPDANIDGMCICTASPHAIRVHAMEAVVKARIAAEREAAVREALAPVLALADKWERLESEHGSVLTLAWPGAQLRDAARGGAR